MSEQQPGLRFDIYERVHLPEEVSAIQELDEVELTPQIRVTVEGDQAIVKGFLLLTGSYTGQAEGEGVGETRTLEHRIPVEITLPINRVRSLDDISIEIENFDIDLLSARSLNVTGVLSLSGIEMQTGEPDVWHEEEEVLFVHEAAKRDESPENERFEPFASNGEPENTEPLIEAEKAPDYEAMKTEPAEEIDRFEPLATNKELEKVEPPAKAEKAPEHEAKKIEPAEEIAPLAKTEPEAKGEPVASAEPSVKAETTPIIKLGAKSESVAEAESREQEETALEAADETEIVVQVEAESDADAAEWKSHAHDYSSSAADTVQRETGREKLPDGNTDDFDALADYDNMKGEQPVEPSVQAQPTAAPVAENTANEEAEKGEMKIAFGSKKSESHEPFDLKSYAGKTDDYRPKPAAAASTSVPAPTTAGVPRFGKPFRGEPEPVSEPTAETAPSDVLEWKNLFLSANEEQQFRKVRLCIVHKEDTLESIAKKYDRKPQEIRLYNGLNDQEVTEGQVIYIP